VRDEQAVGVFDQVVAGQQQGLVGVPAQVCGGNGDDLAVTSTYGGRGRSFEQLRPGRGDERGGHEHNRVVAGVGALDEHPIAAASPAMKLRISWSEQVLSTGGASGQPLMTR